MNLADDLLEQARHLIERDAARPRQASLRRAISTAYYSLFHLMVADATSLLVRSLPLRSAVARSFDHKTLRSAAVAVGEAFRGPSGSQGLRGFLRLPVARELAKVCDTFVNLQEQRHRADYDIAQRFTRAEANGLVSDALDAHTEWRRERNTHNATVLVLASAKLIGTR